MVTRRRARVRAGRQSGATHRPIVALSAPLLRCTFWLLAVLALTPSEAAGPPQRAALRVFPDSPWELVLEPLVVLDPVVAAELTGSSESLAIRSAGSASAVAVTGTELVVDPGGLRTPPLRHRILRELPVLWRMTLPAGVELRDLLVSYELVSGSGRRGFLSYPGVPGSQVQTLVRSTFPQEVERDDDQIVIEGGVILELDMTTARLAGNYAGVLTVTVQQR